MTLRSCSPRLEKLSLFSPPPPCAKIMARGFRCLRAAIRAARPHLGSIFEKLLDQKTFICLRLRIGNNTSKENGLSHPAKGGSPLLLPASVLQLPRCLARTYNLDFHDLTLFELDSFKNAIAAGKTDCRMICFANVGYSPTPRQHF